MQAADDKQAALADSPFKRTFSTVAFKESLFAILLFGLFLKIHGFIGITHAFDEFVPGIQFAGADAGA